jgi:5-methylcytosine-specific restriction endonuclease McrA
MRPGVRYPQPRFVPDFCDLMVSRDFVLKRDGYRCTQCGNNGAPTKEERLSLGAPPANDRNRLATRDRHLAIEALFRRRALTVVHLTARRGDEYAYGEHNRPENLKTLCRMCAHSQAA